MIGFSQRKYPSKIHSPNSFSCQKNAETAFSASTRKREVPHTVRTFLIKMRLVRIIITLLHSFLTLKGNLLAFHPHPETFGPFPAMSGSSKSPLSLLPRWILSLPYPEELSWLLYDMEEAPMLFFSFFFLYSFREKLFGRFKEMKNHVPC